MFVCTSKTIGFIRDSHISSFACLEYNLQKNGGTTKKAMSVESRKKI